MGTEREAPASAAQTCSSPEDGQRFKLPEMNIFLEKPLMPDVLC